MEKMTERRIFYRVGAMPEFSAKVEALKRKKGLPIPILYALAMSEYLDKPENDVSTILNKPRQPEKYPAIPL